MTKNLLKYVPKLKYEHRRVLSQILYLSRYFKQLPAGTYPPEDDFQKLALTSYQEVTEAFECQHKWNYLDYEAYKTTKELAQILEIEFTAKYEKQNDRT